MRVKLAIFKDSLINGFICRFRFPETENITCNIICITASKVFYLKISMNKLITYLHQIKLHEFVIISKK